MRLSRTEKICLGILLIIFTCFTWRGLYMFYSGDDMMNMYGAWKVKPWTLGKSLLFIWMPVYRPLGAVVYRVFYRVFGFHNLPLYVFCWLLLVANALLAYRFFRAMGAGVVIALTALALILVHGNFQDLYLSAGTIYDRLWFLFTVLGLMVYARRRLTAGSSLLLCLLSILAMDSKESGVALPALLLCYEAVFVVPSARREGKLSARIRDIAPLFAALAVLSVVFIFLRVNRTPELMGTGAYHAQASLRLWLTRIAEYLTALSYSHISVSRSAAAVLTIASAAVALWLRNRAMIFGWLFFVITITPVALIAARPGYVLYVPGLGLALYAATALGLLLHRWPRIQPWALATIAIALLGFHARNWPGPFLREASPEWRLTDQFRRDYPALPHGAKLLFVKDEFPAAAWDLMFNIRLMYGDDSIIVHRLQGPKDQQGDPEHPMQYDHVFADEDGRYVELETRNLAESVRLHVLRDYAVARDADFGRRDHVAYLVSGIYDFAGGDPSRWTSGHAQLKFELYPAPAIFSAKFWVPDFVVRPTTRTLLLQVNGQPAGSVALTKDGENQVSFPVSPAQITLNGFTLVDLVVDKPYRNAAGQEFGVVLMRAGFEYRGGNRSGHN